MEYRKDGDDEYTSIEGDSVTGLAPGTYYVRYAETTNYNASSDVKITIEQGECLINRVELTINTPTGGQNLDETITSSTVGVKSVSLNWTDSTNNDKEGIAEYYPWAYTAHITVTPDTGYKIDENVEVTINGYNISEPTSINEGVLSFTQEFYSTKHQLTSVTAPKTPETFNSFYYSKYAVINSNSQLVNTVTAVVDGENVQLPITWSIDYYDEKDGAENTFNWTANFDKENYDVSDSCVTSGSVKIKNKKLIPVTITPTNAIIKYDGSTIDVSKYFDISETSSDAAYSLSSGKGKLDGTILTVEETGEFKIHVSTQQKGDYANASADVTLTIEKGDIKYIATGYDGTYDGNENSISVDAKNANVTYSTDGENYSSNNPSFKDAGEYTVYYRIEANNYNTVNDKATVKISKKTITGTITSNGGTYGSTITGATVKLNGLVGEDNPTVTLKYNGSTEVPKNAGTYKVVATIEDNNYSLSETSAKFVIDKANPNLSVSAVSDKTYGDKEFELDIKQSGTGKLAYTSSNEKVVKVDSNGTVSIVGAGNAKLTVKVDESDNYTSSSASVDVKVKKANGKLEVSKLTYNKTYGDEPFSIGATSETGTVSYKSNNSNVVTVDSNGLVSIVGVGEATISVDAASSDNYNGVYTDVKVVVSARSISNATVTLGDVLSYTGSEQTQKIKSVKIDGIDVTYSVSGNKAKDVGTHTLIITGTGNFTGSKSVDYTIVPTKANQMKENADGSIQYGKGTITVTGSVLNSKTDLVETLIQDGSVSSDELNAVYNGSTLAISLKITDVSDSLSSDIKSTMKDTATKAGFTIGNQYLDISLYIGDKAITTTSDKVKITINVPESMINTDSKIKRTYYVIRYHDGKVSSIDGTFDEKAKTFTFETDKFSAYALAYKDEKVSEDTTKPSSSESANTGVQSNIGFYAGLIVVAMLGIVVLIKRRKSEQ